MPRIPPKMPRSSFVQLFESFQAPPESPPSELESKRNGSQKSTLNISTHTTKCKCLLVRSNEDPRRCPEYPRRCPGRLLFNFSRASRCHQNRLYRSSHLKVAARGKVHKISAHTRGRNVNVSWFGVTRTPEDAPVIFCRYGLAGLVRGPRQRFLRPKTFVPAPVPRVLINFPSC